MTTPLFKDAILEAKKLKEVARAEATNAIVEAISPFVQKMVEQEIAEKSSMIVEQDEPVVEDPALAALDAEEEQGMLPPASDPGTAGAVPPMDSPIVPPMDGAPAVGSPGATAAAIPPSTSFASSPPMAAPVASPTSAGVPMPGQDGSITIDLSSLYVNTPEGQEPVLTDPALASPVPGLDGAGMPSPGGMEAGTTSLPPTPSPSGESPEANLGFPVMEESKIIEASLQELENLLEFSRKISDVPSKTFLSGINSKLLSLFELNQKLSDKKQKRLNVFLLESLYKKLNDLETLKNGNSYSERNKEENNMKKVMSLKEFATSLFEGTDGSLETGDLTPKGSAGFGDDGKVAPKTDSKKTADKQSTAMLAGAKKNQTNGGKDVEDPEKGAKKTLEESVDEELMEAFGLGGEKSLETLKEEEEVVEEGTEETVMEVAEETVEEGLQESLQKKLLKLREESAKIQKQLAECGMSEDHDMGGMSNPNQPVVKISVTGADVEVVDDTAGSDLDVSDDDMDLGMGSDESAGEDEIDIELSDDGDSDDLEADEAGSDLDKLDELETLAENIKLRKELNETRMVTARSLYINKIFANHELSSQQKQTVVEYLDKAQTIAEAKGVYTRIMKLFENKGQTAKKLSGSSSRSTTSGATKLNEGKSNGNSFVAGTTPAVMNLTATAERWQKLAGISKKSV